MPVIPPKTLDHPDRAVGCQEAIGEVVRAVADEALAKGWGREEITVALMEVANGWYFEAGSAEATSDSIARPRRLS
jgi:hypothetical protein